MSQNLQNFVKFQKFQLENLVDFEKCCKTHIYLQKSEPIQPKTSNILPKFCQPTLSDETTTGGILIWPRRTARSRSRSFPPARAAPRPGRGAMLALTQLLCVSHDPSHIFGIIKSRPFKVRVSAALLNLFCCDDILALLNLSSKKLLKTY